MKTKEELMQMSKEEMVAMIEKLQCTEQLVGSYRKELERKERALRTVRETVSFICNGVGIHG